MFKKNRVVADRPVWQRSSVHCGANLPSPPPCNMSQELHQKRRLKLVSNSNLYNYIALYHVTVVMVVSEIPSKPGSEKIKPVTRNLNFLWISRIQSAANCLHGTMIQGVNRIPSTSQGQKSEPPKPETFFFFFLLIHPILLQKWPKHDNNQI